MTRLPTGHHTISMMMFEENGWDLPWSYDSNWTEDGWWIYDSNAANPSEWPSNSENDVNAGAADAVKGKGKPKGNRHQREIPTVPCVLQKTNECEEIR